MLRAKHALRQPVSLRTLRESAVGQRSSAETVVAVCQRFLQRRTWKQVDLARDVNVGVRQLRVVLVALQDTGVPLEQEDDPPHVYWSVPKTWLLSMAFAI